MLKNWRFVFGCIMALAAGGFVGLSWNAFQILLAYQLAFIGATPTAFGRFAVVCLEVIAYASVALMGFSVVIAYHLFRSHSTGKPMPRWLEVR